MAALKKGLKKCNSTELQILSILDRNQHISSSAITVMGASAVEDTENIGQNFI